jgi:uncharacterized protein (TIGR02453 family)
MIDKKIMSFLTDLKENNNREWFEENKGRYQEARKIFLGFVQEYTAHLLAIDPEIGQLNARDRVFRLYRDIRFSKIKLPYKTNFGAVFKKGGKKSGYGAYYLHVEPDNSFLGGGMWRPDAPHLKALRAEIYHYTDEFKKILANKDFQKHFGGRLEGEKLKTAPKGYPKDWQDIDLLRYKSYTVFTPLSDELLTSPGLMPRMDAAYAAMKPFIYYLNRAIDYNLPDN